MCKKENDNPVVWIRELENLGLTFCLTISASMTSDSAMDSAESLLPFYRAVAKTEDLVWRSEMDWHSMCSSFPALTLLEFLVHKSSYCR